MSLDNRGREDHPYNVLNQRDEPSVLLGDDAIAIDKKKTENELRRLTIGRKNWLFVGDVDSG